MFLYFVKEVKWKLGKEGDKQGEELLDKNKKGLSEKSIESTLGSALFSVFRVQKNRPFL